MDEYSCVVGKKGFPTYTYNKKFLYSQYDPHKEAASYLNRYGALKSTIITFCGADFINKKLVENKENNSTILSFEPVYFEPMCESPRLRRFNSLKILENYLLSHRVTASHISLIYWQPFIESNSGQFLPLLKSINGIIKKSTLSSNTADKMDFLETKNLFLNIHNLKKIDIITPEIKKQKNPAFILSSGYSLKDNISYIKKAASYGTTFALPSAVPYLISRDVIPDYIIAVDPGYGTFYHLLQYAQLPLTVLTTLNITPSTFRLSNFNFLYFSYNSKFEKYIYNQKNIVTSDPEGSVFFNVLSIIIQLGFTDALIFGQDFGFKDNRSHIEGGAFENIFITRSSYFDTLEQLVKKLETAKNPDTIQLKEREIKTDVALKVYYDHFLSKSFPINLFLPEKAYNTLQNRLKTLSLDYVTTHYSPLKDRKIPISSLNITKLKDILYTEHTNSIKNIFKNKQIGKKLKFSRDKQ